VQAIKGQSKRHKNNTHAGVKTQHRPTIHKVQPLDIMSAITSKEKAKGIWLCADHFSAQYRTKPLDPTIHSAANA
jgi:hypothetical protein